MPLYVTNGKLQLGEPGKLAAQRACCCDEEGDDPGDCMCPDLCIYQIQLVSPIQGPKFPQLPCFYFDNFFAQTSERVVDFTDCLPEILPVAGHSPATFIGPGFICPVSETFQHWVDVGNFAFMLRSGYEACFSAYRFYPDLVSQDQPFVSVATRVVVRTELYCLSNNAENPQPQHYLGVSLLLDSSATQNESSNILNPITKFGGITHIKRAIYLLDSGECRRDDDRHCSTPEFGSMRKSYATTPLEIELNLDGTSLGPWQEVNEFSAGEDSSLAQCGFDAQAAFSLPVTYRITQRPSCRIVNCDCSASLDGLKATFEGKEFTLGTEFPYSETFDGYELITTHFKDFSGDYIFEKYKVLDTPAGAIGDVQSVKVFCEVDTEVDPQVPRWYAEFVSICRTVEANTNVSAETKRTEIGYFLCSESAGCAGRPEGDPIPLGSAQEIEEIPGSPETPGGKESCTPPARADLTIFEDCG